MKEFITSSQLFWANPDYNSNLTLILSLVSVLMIITGIIVWFGLKNKSEKIPPYGELRNKIMSLLATTGIIGLLLGLFSWQEIPYLSSRLLVLILAFIFVIWFIFILIYIKRDLSRELKEFQQVQRFKKYLPRKKVG